MTPTPPEFSEEYHTPATTSEAFTFGKQSGRFGHDRLTWDEFHSAPQGEPHPFPESLYRAYLRGRELGEARRASRAGASE